MQNGRCCRSMGNGRTSSDNTYNLVTIYPERSVYGLVQLCEGYDRCKQKKNFWGRPLRDEGRPRGEERGE